MNKLKPEIIKQIQELALEGKSVREIAVMVDAHKFTVNRYMNFVDHPNACSDKPKKPYQKKRKEHYLNCGYCDKEFLDKNGEKTSDLKCGRIKRAYCSHRCAMNYRSKQKHNDKCKRCDKTRIEISRWLFPDSPYQATGVSFSKGYCPKCRALLLQYKGDEQLVKTHELTQQLKQELRHDHQC